MGNVFSFESCQTEIIGQLKLHVTNSTLDDWQLLNLTFVCTDIHYDQKFVLCNKISVVVKFFENQVKIHENYCSPKFLSLKYLK